MCVCFLFAVNACGLLIPVCVCVWRCWILNPFWCLSDAEQSGCLLQGGLPDGTVIAGADNLSDVTVEVVSGKISPGAIPFFQIQIECNKCSVALH